ncbi:hypothetical protein ABZW49_42835 [Nonomuraea wenchangensis]
MQRITTTIGALAAAGMLAFALPSTAHAAIGWMTINGRTFMDPSGCHTETVFQPLNVNNRTDRRAIIFPLPDCNGELVAVLPKDSADSYYGATSVLID